MTFSLVARCRRTGQLGVGALTAMMGIGKLATHARAGVGAIATQATMNPYLGFDGLRLLDQGVAPDDALRELIDADPGRDVRQTGFIDHQGRTAAWSGALTPDWSGHAEADDVVAQGNRLVGKETLDAALAAFTSQDQLPLAERLLVALEAGEATGADTKGTLSGTIYVVDTEEYPLWDLRVDHATDPAKELRRVFLESSAQLLPQVLALPTRENPLGAATRRALGHQSS
ncbi:DUF1028 domain-containing protein [Phytoactinopolyspora limicola]|uniref:DUF1028 domain-containing protein n=1 Tax=Phytoactinopolyspora limicola TaxID=2715536 RepID=UPI00140D833A|nr:DUF1028 domain-containing protein [Phytoactinopolyspora limicola]